MKKATGQIEELFINITFAEDREFASIKDDLKNIEDKLDNTFTAITFAEAGEFRSAARYINKAGQAPKYDRRSSHARRLHRLCSGRA